MAKKKLSTRVFKDEEEMDTYLEGSDLGKLFEQHGRFRAPRIRKINLDLPEWLIADLDLEAARAGVARQPLIKLWLAQKLDEERKKRAA